MAVAEKQLVFRNFYISGFGLWHPDASYCRMVFSIHFSVLSAGCSRLRLRGLG